MPTQLITLNCPNCGGILQAAGQDTYTCSYCGATHRLSDHPDWLQRLQENIDQLNSDLKNLQTTSCLTASAQALPGLLAEMGQISQALQARGRAVFISLLVFGLGYFLNRWLIFTPDSGWIRYLPVAVMVLGGLGFLYTLTRTILLIQQRNQVNQQIEQCREAMRNLRVKA
ncbi:MAG TPA: hypothetical protein VN452_00305 [Longilinea sp.]|nr:hypothetical protein [Longilinea sp.]